MANFSFGLPQKKVTFDKKLGEVEKDSFSGQYSEEEAHALADAARSEYAHDQTLTPTPLKAFAVLISTFAAFVTGINSFEWFILLRPAYVAVPMAMTIVGAAIFLPDFGVIFWKNGRRLLGGGVFFVGTIAIALSMATTVAAQYNTYAGRTVDEEAARRDGLSQRQELARALQDKARIEGEISRLNRAIDSTQRKIDDVPLGETGSRESQILQNRLILDQKSRRAYEDQLAGLASRVTDLQYGSESVRTADFYGFIASVLNADESSVKFWMSVVPAMFLELIAPVMVALIIL